MGDRATAVLIPHQPQTGEGAPLATICCYTHWRGTELPQLVAQGIYEAKPRWGESSYVVRQIISAILRDDLDVIDGYGIGLTPYGIPADAHRPMLVVDCRTSRAGYLPWQRWPLREPVKLDYDFEAFIQVGAYWPGQKRGE